MARPLNAESKRSRAVTRSGRLDSLFGHHGLKGRLWEPNGTVWTCHFKREHLPRLRHGWMRCVTVTGHLKGLDRDTRELMVDSMKVDEPLEASTASGDFFKTVPLEELARQQGVGPVRDVNALFALWPGDEDPDELLDYILRKRERERKALRRRRL